MVLKEPQVFLKILQCLLKKAEKANLTPELIGNCFLFKNIAQYFKNIKATLLKVWKQILMKYLKHSFHQY
jgi:hypothetical protein